MAAHGIGYRPDIDGLRTVAVLPVVLFHAGAPGFAGGYVGVDIFFVISGFLISSILIGDIDRGRYSIARFYERRIRRIFPALAVVVLACLTLGFIVLTPVEYGNLGKSAIAVSAFVSNFYFWRSVNYFDNAQAIQPLLHTWSLAVEEQFYILYPPLLALLAKRWRRSLVPVLTAIALASLVLAAFMVFRKPSATFYLPFTRAWELLAGALLAVRVWPAPSPRWRAAAGLVGLALAVVPIALYDARTAFPGLAALPPVLGAALIIWAGTGNAAHPAGRLLSTAPMTFVGRISYSLYLWHVPVFAFAVYLTGGPLGVAAATAAVALSMALAWASYRFVETPFRVSRPNWRPATIGAAAMAGVLALALGVAVTGGVPARLDARGQALVETAGDQQRFHVECLSNGEVIVPPARACRLGRAGAAPTALLWGDSHAMVTATPMEEAAKRRGTAFLFAATADCPVGIGFAIDEGTEPGLTKTPSYRFCETYNREMLALVRATPSIRHVVLSSRWSNWRIGEPNNPAEGAVDIRLRDTRGVARSPAENAAIFERGLRRLIDALRAAGKEVHIVGPLPEPQFNVPQRLFVQQFGFVDAARPLDLDGYRRRHARILALFERLRREGQVRFIWPVALLCHRDVCPIEERGHAVFFDHNHLSNHAARNTSVLYRGVFG